MAKALRDKTVDLNKPRVGNNTIVKQLGERVTIVGGVIRK